MAQKISLQKVQKTRKIVLTNGKMFDIMNFACDCKQILGSTAAQLVQKEVQHNGKEFR